MEDDETSESQPLHSGVVDKPKIPERQPIPTPQAFLADVRRSILGEKPEPQRIETFEQTMAGRALGVVEKYFQLEEKYPFKRRRRYVGSAILTHLLNTIGDRHIGLDIGDQYRLIVQENGTMSIFPPTSGGDDRLIYDTPPYQGGLGVHIDGKTGTVSAVRGLGEKKVAQETQTRINTMLDITSAYYDAFQRVRPLVESFRQVTGSAPDGLFPSFPAKEIRQLRLG